MAKNMRVIDLAEKMDNERKELDRTLDSLPTQLLNADLDRDIESLAERLRAAIERVREEL